MGERYFDLEPESYITTENAEKAIDDAYKRGKVEMLSVIEQIRAEIKNYLEDEKYSDDGISDVGVGLQLALNIIDRVVKEYEA